MAGFNKVDDVEYQKRILIVSKLLRRKPIKIIIEYIKGEWGLQEAQAYNYIKEAKKEWIKYFKNLKRAGMSYHVTQLRDLKDQAYSQKVTVGKGDNKQVITVPNLPLVLDITREEAKLMGVHPAGKIEGDIKIAWELVDPKKDKEST